jgi:uncharacterized protein (TIGR02598 family)
MFKQKLKGFNKKNGNFLQCAFSLVEVAVALAISAVSIVGIIALVPMAAQTQRTSNEMSVCGLISRQLVSEARQADFDTLMSSATTTYRYFDNEGFETSRPRQIYTAELVFTPRVDVPGPGSTRVNLNDFARLRVRIAKNQLGRIATDTAVFTDPNQIIYVTAAYIGRKESVEK